MPSSPKIQKEAILKTAFDLLLREGYASINIKTVAAELGCSTQPISRQFGSMEGFRKELLVYCLTQLKSFFSVKGEKVSEIVTGIAKGYINLAFDFPNLYKYLYMMKHEEEKMSALLNLLRSENYERILFMLKSEYGMEEKEAKEYLNNLNYYVHGVASYVAIGYVDASKKEIMKRVQKVNEGLLKNRKDL
ncbi:MAG: TetR/AcrR family transcriptional regulator [Lachnospiraceae bacterium]|nr:TetR/AcrR family transcriptional regulator [Lachnospiraceae bacterium]